MKVPRFARAVAVAAFLFQLSFSSYLFAAVVNKEELFPRFTIAHGRLDQDGLPLSGARLCLLPEKTSCFEMPSEPFPGSGSERYQFGLWPHSDRHSLKNGGSWVLFSSIFSGGGSGILTRFALLRLTPQRTLQNLLPEVVLTDDIDVALWDLATISQFPLLVTAEPFWDMKQGEIHFEPHRQTIHVWRLDPGAQAYVLLLSYRSSVKYDKADEQPSNPVHVLSSERSEIVKRLSVLTH